MFTAQQEEAHKPKMNVRGYRAVFGSFWESTARGNELLFVYLLMLMLMLMRIPVLRISITFLPIRPSQVETPKRETEGVRGRVRLKADRSLLADLYTPNNANAAPISVPRRLGSRSPDSRASQPSSSSPNTSG